jgi:hypothetical protein
MIKENQTTAVKWIAQGDVCCFANNDWKTSDVSDVTVCLYSKQIEMSAGKAKISPPRKPIDFFVLDAVKRETKRFDRRNIVAKETQRTVLSES